MANDLDEVTGPINEAGRDVNVINKQIPVQIGTGSLLFEIALWAVVPARKRVRRSVPVSVQSLRKRIFLNL